MWDMDAKRTRLQDDVLACARIADTLHQMGKRDLANAMIDAMYCLLSSQNDKIVKPAIIPTSATKKHGHNYKLVVNAESGNSNGTTASILS
jgi:hypothetical protein